MIGTLGHVALVLAFLAAVGTMVAYWRIAQSPASRLKPVADPLFALHGLLVLAASAVLVWLIFNHQFQYYYVFNYTSKDLQAQYLWAAFYSGQEGSILMWVLFSVLVGWALIRWTPTEYKAPVMVFMMLTQVFLLSMVLGLEIFGTKIGASPFRLLREQMPNAPIFMNDPNFVPADGSGLNDLLRSPWIVIHPPVLFLGFASMTVPFAFALAAVWQRKYREWVRPALPWALAANVFLLTAIFLGGYWAYVTLSFGGYWAWDPVENASLVPWLVGTAGIHTMLIQRRKDTGVFSSIVFAVLAYVLIVYSTFLTRSGVLGEASVHSFVDLGLYNQLLLFMLTMLGVGVVLIGLRFREMPSATKESPILSREVMAFLAALMLFLLGFVIIVGTSSPILGKLFVENPTPPDIAFYVNWSMPFGIAIAVATVVGQLVWWRRTESWENVASRVLVPVILASAATIAAVVLADIREVRFMVYLMSGFIGLFGNGFILAHLLRKNPKLVGGAVSHIGFAVLIIGFLGAAYDRPLLDAETDEYNRAVKAGMVTGDDGFPVVTTIDMVELKKGEPKLLGGRWQVTYMDGQMTERNRPGEQEYTLKFEDTRHAGAPFFMMPTVYPMLANSNPGNLNWTVDPEVRTGWFSDLYVYVAGSSMVERERERLGGVSQLLSEDGSMSLRTLKLKKGASVEADGFRITFREFELVDAAAMAPNTTIAVRALLDVTPVNKDSVFTLNPMFSIVREDTVSNIQSETVAFSRDRQIRFVNVNPSSGEIELQLFGVNRIREAEWILLTIEKKPLVSVVWLGTFLLMIGFSIAIFRRWNELKDLRHETSMA
jgi:cytochrome c-type biogenesis protein CcmF